MAEVIKVLVVEDNPLNLDMLARRLERKGFKVIQAVNGQVGVELATKEMPHIILMDMSLPVLSGWDAVKQLKANQHTNTIPVIALTAHAMKGDYEKAMNAGCDDYDTKPIDLTRLLGKMEKLLK